MRWLDVFGPPGSGKSTLCDPLWGPHEIDFGGINSLNPRWQDYLKICDKLMQEVSEHPTIDAMGRMLWRSLRKICAVEALIPAYKGETYIQTALAQRGLGFGWRLHDLNKVELVREYFEIMPVSHGVALIDAPISVVEERNRLRETVPETAHENRSHMVAKMQPAIEIAKEVLRDRTRFLVIDATQPIEQSRQQLIDFATGDAVKRSPVGYSGQVEAISVLP